MRVLVIGGYVSDQLQSMERYADLLVKLYQPYGMVTLWRPPGLFSRIPLLHSVAKKYLAYIDKIVLFPIKLGICSSSFDLVHIADHGYAYYSFFCNRSRCIVTCHDLLAVRGAMGDESAATGASRIGIWLQRLIMYGLRRSGSVVFPSEASYSDYIRLRGGPSNQKCEVIPSPLNATFSSNPSDFRISSGESSQVPPLPYLLMIGSSLPRKNRILALRVLLRLCDSTPIKLVLAGAPLTEHEKLIIKQHKLQKRVVSIERPSHAFLNFLYCNAHALLFPSFTEGFGWPLIEAQACACPVIASTTSCIPEVVGAGALFADPTDEIAFTKHVLSLDSNELRREMIEKGFLNLRRYDVENIRQQLAAFAFGTT